MAFDTNVFINCPFDEAYSDMLKPLVFSLLYFKFEPQISTTMSSGDIRVQEIMKLMKNSRFSIHDISRNKALKKGDIARFNMPYEMGLDIGCQNFGNKQMKTKKCLILDETQHTYDVALSDISGQDIKAHGNDPQVLISKVRDWLMVNLDDVLPSKNKVWQDYLEFYADYEEMLTDQGFTKADIEKVTTFEYMKVAKAWIKQKGI